MDRFERINEELASIPEFTLRIVKCVLMALVLMGIALAIGIAGYHWIAGFDWLDSLLEAAMILGGMGPIKDLPSGEAKVFAAVYALFSGLVFIGVMGLVLAPVAHRILHAFHVDEDD